ncbi:zinc finger CCCH domain-containing protein 37-like [Phragmites australis]|uniref:zinc finger CCCH domain-containing protein 37-like n=1 Tax=Phragmites australis TaxID=29695 RepID=UPI002D77E269|nr:zinc finger CCCH domain-containing protein 37-like [Phragmites australis]
MSRKAKERKRERQAPTSVGQRPRKLPYRFATWRATCSTGVHARPRTPPRAKPTAHAATPTRCSSATKSALNTAHATPSQPNGASVHPASHAATYKAARHTPRRCHLKARLIERGGQAGMVSREHHHDYEHLVLDSAALGVSWADPAAVEIPPQLFAALGEYLSAGHGYGDAEAEDEADDEFMMYEFKVRRCARARSHDWTACPYAHPGEAARRRDPRRVAYTGEPCPDFRRRPGAACPQGNKCPFAHGTFELWLHPLRYRTRPCRTGTACRRHVCFFAHTAGELRAAPKGDSPLSLSPKSTLASLWESPPVSPVEERQSWVDPIDESDADAEMEEFMLAMRELSIRKASASSAPVAPVLPPVTEDDGPDFGWVSELVM